MSAATLTGPDGGQGLRGKGLVRQRELTADPHGQFSPAGPLLGPLSYETGETPALFHRLFHGSAHGVSRNPMVPRRFARMLPNRALRVGRRAGLGASQKPGACSAGCFAFGVAPSPTRRPEAEPPVREPASAPQQCHGVVWNARRGKRGTSNGTRGGCPCPVRTWPRGRPRGSLGVEKHSCRYRSGLQPKETVQRFALAPVWDNTNIALSRRSVMTMSLPVLVGSWIGGGVLFRTQWGAEPIRRFRPQDLVGGGSQGSR